MPSASASPYRLEAAIGEWAIASQYDFRVIKVRRCGAEPQAKQPGPLHLGVQVEVKAKVHEVIASSRDVTLERDGVILQSELKPEPGAACTPLLEPKLLDRGQSATGFVVFEVPEEAFARSAKLAFKPTRWGGAPRVQVDVPECLDRCEPLGSPGKTAKVASPRR
jgi:hypothetical protein